MDPQAIRVIAGQLFFSCLSIALLLQARPQIALRIFNNNTSKASRRLSSWASLAAAGEFLLGPTFGSLSDAHGRKWLMLLSPCINIALRSLFLVRPSARVLMVESILTSSFLCAATISTSASIADLASGKAQAMASAKIGICAGFAFIVGPIGAGLLIKRGGPRLAFSASILASTAQMLLVLCQFTDKRGHHSKKRAEEGGSTCQRVPSVPCPPRKHRFQGFVSPFRFTRLFTTPNRSLRILTLVGLLQTFCEPKTWNSMTQLYMRVNVGVAPEKIGRFFAAFGIAAIASKGLTRAILRRKGPAFHTTISNLATALSFLCWGADASSKAFSIAMPLLLAPFNMDRRAGVNSRASDAASDAGFGKAEHAALFGNLRALAVSFAPLLFGRIYAWSNAKPGRKPGLGFWVAAMFALAAEAIHSNLSEKMLDEKEKNK